MQGRNNRPMHSLTRSLTLRLVSLFVLVISSLLVGLASITLIVTDRHFMELDDAYLREKAALVKEIARHADNTEALRARIASAIGNETGLNVWFADPDKGVFRSGAAVLPEEVARRLIASSFKPEPPNQTAWAQIEQIDLDKPASALAVELVLGNNDSSDPIRAILTLSSAHHDHYMASFRTLIWAYVALAIAIGGLLGWWAARKGLNPLRPIIAKTRDIDASQLADRIPVADTPLELQPLATTINQMLGRLESDFARLSDFASDLAHELRTPISNMLVQAQVTLSKDRDASHYAEAMHSMVEELERLSTMVSDMLYLAKTEHLIQAPHAQTVDLAREAVELAEFYSLIAEERQVDILVTGDGSVQGDRSMIRRAISNLLSNALRYANSSSPVRIEISRNALETRLSVSNIGPSIPGEIQTRLFDRFYRADDARTHPGSEGAGLGLAITQAVMKAHGGSITVSSTESLTTFTLIFRVVRGDTE